jgi:basic membrane protein A
LFDVRKSGVYKENFKMKKMSFLLIGLLAVMLVLGACTPAEPEVEEPEVEEPEVEEPEVEEPEVEEPEVEEPEEEEVVEELPKIALVPAGRVGKEGFMFLSGQGYKQAAAEFGFEERILESEVAEEWERNVRTAAQDGYTLIVGVGNTMSDAIANVAAEFPDIMFALVDGNPGLDNTVGLIAQEQEGSFLAGALAAMMTTETGLANINEEKVIGFVGGMEVPSVVRWFSGYEQGAKYIDPDIQVQLAYVGSFNDPAKSKELALAMFQEQNVDIVMSVAGSPGDVGVFEAVEETGFYGIGADVDWDDQVPGQILTSVLKKTDVAVYDVIARYLEGTLEAGEVLYGVTSGVMDITDMANMGDAIPQAVLDKIDEIKAGIASGEIVIERPN